MVIHIIIALLIAFVSGLGIGGGGLFATYLAVFTDIPQISVQGFNLLFFLFCAAASVIVQIFRRKIDLGVVCIMVLAGLVGALGGSALASFVSNSLLRRIFGIMLTATGIISLKSSMRHKYSQKRSTEKNSDQENATSETEKDGEKDTGNQE